MQLQLQMEGLSAAALCRLLQLSALPGCLCFALLGTFERRSGMQVRMHLLIWSQKKAEIRKRSQRNERPKNGFGWVSTFKF